MLKSSPGGCLAVLGVKQGVAVHTPSSPGSAGWPVAKQSVVSRAGGLAGKAGALLCAAVGQDRAELRGLCNQRPGQAQRSWEQLIRLVSGTQSELTACGSSLQREVWMEESGLCYRPH